MSHSYHHGDLRRAVLDHAVAVIAAEGPAHFSLRSLAADLGVSHTAPRHHFGSREGVLNAVAAEGFTLLAAALRAIREAGGGFLDVGVAYVQFALEHPGHFEVMFSPKLLDETDPDLQAARTVTFGELRGGVAALEATGQVDDAPAAVLAAWSVVHGIATLALTGNIEASQLRTYSSDGDLLEITRRSAALLFRPETR
ncbi:MAG TPA: TetR-like C-terminal domain-containing protein [Microlunatus sp.]